MGIHNDFHYLIEIAVNLNKSIEEERRLSTPSGRNKKIFWEKKMKEWLEDNYNDPGIKLKELENL